MVETTPPRVVVHESRPLRVMGAPPVVASFYVPMPLQFGAFAPPNSKGPEENVRLDFSGLDAAFELERSQARLAAIKAVQEAQTRRLEAVMERVGAAARESAVFGAPKPAPSDKCCEDLSAQLKNLANRVDRLEQLVIFHDRSLRDSKQENVKIPAPQK
jgi:hypothetical protein